MARPLTIRNLLDEHRRALGELAVREYREPDDQAAFLIVEGLRQAGVLEELKNQLAGSMTRPVSRAPSGAATMSRHKKKAPTHPSLENEGVAGAQGVTDEHSAIS